MALIIALIALSITSVLGLSMFLNAMVEVRISDNNESRARARCAAEAGINHARALLSGLSFDELLKGPDGAYDESASYLNQARSRPFRNPLPWNTARGVSIVDPSIYLSGIGDDGLISTGKYSTGNATVLVPLNGIPLNAANPYTGENTTLARYFIRVTDNNGEKTELARDEADNPFYDGDGIIIIRSIGVAPTIRETGASTVWSNAMAVYEARFQIQRQFDLPAAITLQGTRVKTKFSKNGFLIDGGANSYGIATMNPDAMDENPDEDSDYDDTDDRDLLDGWIVDHLKTEQLGRILGKGWIPSVDDISEFIYADPDLCKLLDADFLWDFVTNQVPAFADSVFYRKQDWNEGKAPDLGYYDITKYPGDPCQRPRVTYVDGALKMKGDITGGGLLVVKGKLTIEGDVQFNGLILVLGKAKLTIKGNAIINGGIYEIGLKHDKRGFKFVKPNLKVENSAKVIYNRDAIRAAAVRMPIRQISIREITRAMDQ